MTSNQQLRQYTQYIVYIYIYPPTPRLSRGGGEKGCVYATWRPRVGWWLRSRWVFRGSKGTVRNPGKAGVWSRFGSQSGGVLALYDVGVFEACGGFWWTVCVCWVLALNEVVFFEACGGLCVCIWCFCMLL